MIFFKEVNTGVDEGPMNRFDDYQILDFLQNTNLFFEYTSVPVWHPTSCSGLPPPWHWSLPRICGQNLHCVLGEVVGLLSQQKNIFCLPLLFSKKLLELLEKVK